VTSTGGTSAVPVSTGVVTGVSAGGDIGEIGGGMTDVVMVVLGYVSVVMIGVVMVALEYVQVVGT